MAPCVGLLGVVLAVFLGAVVLLPYTESARSSGFYTDNEFHRQTVLVDHLPSAQRRAVKQEILDLLGLKKKPKPSAQGTRDAAPSYMLEVYRSLSREDELEGTGRLAMAREVRQQLLQRNLTLPGMEQELEKADIIMSFVNYAHKQKHLRHEASKRFYFDFQEVPYEVELRGAELRMYKRAVRGNGTFHINIERITDGYGITDHSLTPEVNTSVSADYEGWLDLNITTSATQWTYFRSTNLGLQMTITNSLGEEMKPHEIGIIGRHGEEDKRAFMVAFFRATQEVKVRRSRSTRKRTRADTTPNDQPYNGGWNEYPGVDGRYNGRVCQRKSLYVSFKDLNWQEWIIAPEGYTAYYCAGECSFPLNVHMNATNHAIVQTLVHLMDNRMAPKPRCAPTKLSAISVLFFDDNSNVILKKYRNMVVKACGCQ